MKFTWPGYPQSQSEFERLMSALDNALSAEGLQPFQRPLHVGRKLWEALAWGGNALPPESLADAPDFVGDALMAKAQHWYVETYGNRLKSDCAYGYAPARLGNTIWRVRSGVTYGRVRLFIDRNLRNRGVELGTQGAEASLNVLNDVENLSQGLADRLPEEALREHLAFHFFMHQALQWREQLPQTDLFRMARGDYDQSTSDVVAHRYGQARWGAEQSVEKTLKGFLQVAGMPFPSGGPNGHNLRHIGGLLAAETGIDVSSVLLELAACSPKVRYGDEPSTESQALQANHAVLGVLDQLRVSSKAAALLDLHNKPRS